MILILGASSFVGRRLLEAFGASRAIGTYRNHPVPGGLFFDAAKMRLAEALPPGVDISHTLICFSETGLDFCKKYPERAYDINVRSTIQVIDDLAEIGIKPIFLSSDYVFDGEKGCYTEEDVPNPTTVYGVQKLQVEQYLADNYVDYAVLRLARVFGTEVEDGTILSSWLKRIQNNEEIRCARDQVFSPLHVDDLGAVTDAVIRLNLSGLYNVANTVACSRLEMLNTLLDCLGTKANVIECSVADFDFLDNRPLNLSMNPKKVLEATSLEFRTIQSCCSELVARFEHMKAGERA